MLPTRNSASISRASSSQFIVAEHKSLFQAFTTSTPPVTTSSDFIEPIQPVDPSIDVDEKIKTTAASERRIFTKVNTILSIMLVLGVVGVVLAVVLTSHSSNQT